MCCIAPPKEAKVANLRLHVNYSFHHPTSLVLSDFKLYYKYKHRIKESSICSCFVLLGYLSEIKWSKIICCWMSRKILYKRMLPEAYALHSRRTRVLPEFICNKFGYREYSFFYISAACKYFIYISDLIVMSVQVWEIFKGNIRFWLRNFSIHSACIPFSLRSLHLCLRPLPLNNQ